MLATTFGVVRMRAWGVLLGVMTALAMLVEVLLHRNDFTTWGFALAAVPGLVLAAPLLVSRIWPEKPGTEPRVLRPSATEPPPPARIRVEEFSVEEPGAQWDPETVVVARGD